MEPSVFALNDLVYGRRIVELVKNPNIQQSDQACIACVIKEIDSNTQQSTSDIFLYSAKTCESKQLTRNPKGCGVGNPVFSTGRIEGVTEDSLLFLKQGQVWQIPLNGGESHKVTNFSLPVECFKIFSGIDRQQWIAVVMNVFPSSSPAETLVRDQAESKTECTTGVVYDKLMVRHWDQWGAYRKRHHIFICPLGINSEKLFITKEDLLIDLMFGKEHDCPGKGPGQGDEEFSISLDGKYLAFAARKLNPDGSQCNSFSWSTNVAIYLAELPADSAYSSDKKPVISVHQVSSASSEALNTCPSFSPDCFQLAYLSMARAQYESDALKIHVLNLESRELWKATEDIDLSFQSIEWGLDSKRIYTSAQYQGVNRLFLLKFNSSNCDLFVLPGDNSKSSPQVVVNPFDPATSITLFYFESSLTKPNEVNYVKLNIDESPFLEFRFKSFTSGIKELEDDYLAFPSTEVFVPLPQFKNGDIIMPKVIQHYFEGGGGDMIHAWFLPPVESQREITANKEGKVPLVVIVHGGPQGAILNSWSYRWNLSIFASQGYAVLAVNFHGSSSYGQKFTDSIRNDWGGKPYDDIMKGIDYICRSYNYLDETRIAALGASYGGYMINWMNGHTNLFKCLVNHDGIFSLKNQYYTTEELWFPEWEFGLPWENKDEYEKWSPDTYVSAWNTPTLVIHGGKDYRVCEQEGISTFTALQRKGIDSQLLFFPDENHWVLKAKNSQKWHETVFLWLKKYIS